MKHRNSRSSKVLQKCLPYLVIISMIVAFLPASAGTVAAETTSESLMTDYLPTIHEVIDESGFKHPGVGLTKELLENLQTQVRAQKEPWNTYFDQLVASVDPWGTPLATRTVSSRFSNGSFSSQGFNEKFVWDGLTAYTQALMYVITGDEVYRANAMRIIRNWEQMDPANYAYFTDAHIHTGVPLYRMVTAAEIMRYTSTQNEDLKWTDQDTADLTNNVIVPVTETFNHTNHRFMNQHLYPLIGAISGYIFTGNVERYHEAVEWFTVNKTAVDQHVNGSIKRLFRLVDTNAATGEKVDNPQVQITEMGRDQAHSTGDVINVSIISRLLQAQGTKVDPVDGTVSTAENAVTSYDFLGKRILAGTDHFARYMNGYDTPWIPTEARMRKDGSPVIYNVLSTEYRGRIGGNAYDLYYYYKYEQGLDMEQVAPYYTEMFRKRTNYNWASRDAGGEYWLYIPKEAEAEGTANLPKVNPNPNWKEIEDRFTNLDGNSTAMQEGDVSFVRINATESGSKIALVQSGSGSRVLGYKIRTNGAAKLVAFGETITLPDTQGQWRYVYYEGRGLGTLNYFTIIGNRTTVDIDHINVNAANELTPPVFNEGNTALNLFDYVGSEAALHLDFSATDADTSDVVTYRIAGAPEGAVFDTSTGTFDWNPTLAGTYAFGVEASDGTTVSTRDVTVTVANDRQSAVDAVIGPYDANTDYVWATLDTYTQAYDDTMSVINTATDGEFSQKLAALHDAVQELQLTTPLHTDGSIYYKDMFLSSGFNTSTFLDSVTSTFGNKRINMGVHMDLGPNFRVSASAFGIQARAGFPERGGGITMYGSNDQVNWTRLTPGVTPVSADMHTLTVSPELQNEQFRFLKYEMIDKPYDAPWPELSEFRILGKRHEVINKIASVSIGSDQAFGGRIVIGDTAKLSFQSTEAIENVKVAIQGVPATVHSADGLNWTAEAVMVPGTAPGTLTFTLDYQTAEGIAAPATLFVTDESRLILVDESDVISDVTSITEVSDSYGRSPADAIASANRLFDNNPGTVTDYRLNGSGAGGWVQFDFGQGGYAELSYVELLARQDGYYSRIGGTVIQGSNDNETWKTISTGAVSTRDWQFLSISDKTPYRYIRITNGNSWFGNMAEVRFHGDLDYDVDYFDSIVLAPDGYTKGSYYLYMKEVARIEAAMSEPGADNSGLAAELDQAKNLLVPYTISLYSFEGDANNTFGSIGGTVTGSLAYSAGKVGQAIELNGTDSYVTLPQAHHLSDADDITIAAWVNWGGGKMWQRIFDFGNSTSQYLILTPSSRDDKKLRFKIKNGSSELELETQQLPVGDWAHVAVTLGSGKAKLYMNGELKAEKNVTIKPSDFKPRNNYIGKSNNSADPLFNGKIDEFRIKNSVLNADEIKALYHNTLTWLDNSLITLLLEEAAAVNTELYKEESVEALQAAVSQAESVSGNSDATQEEIDAVSEGLIAALEGLQWKNITATVDPVEPNGNNGWYTSPVTVTLSPAAIAEYSLDGGSTWTAYSEPVILNEDGAHQVLYRRSVDTGEAESLEFHIDLSAPVVQIQGESSYTIDETVTITCSATDKISGVYGTPCEQPLTQVEAYTLKSGEHTETVTVEDMAGHQTTVTDTFEVTVTFESLKTVTNAFLQETGDEAWESVAKAYNKKLDLAKEKADSGKVQAVKDIIDGYIDQVRDHDGKFFTHEQAEILIRWAETVSHQINRQ